MKFCFPDVSFYQYGYIDPPRDWTVDRYIRFDVMRQMTSAVIIRAGQNLWKDRAFDISWKAAKDAGLARGSYWFYDSRVHPKRQAELWVEALGWDLGELPLWCDFEDNYQGQFAGWKHWFDFIERLKELVSHKQIGIYTGYYYWLENTIAKAIPKASLNYFKQYPLWIAAYNNFEPTVPAPWTDWSIWQYTDNGDGKPYGVASNNIDLNYFNGSEAEFYEFFGVTTPPHPSPNQEHDLEREHWQVKAIYQNKEVELKEK
ncbi:MAG TPA: hypothetical protein DIW23_12050 [Anaerolineae bacterium]|nr:hypothetical protein [Anaerolineae bacterium]